MSLVGETSESLVKTAVLSQAGLWWLILALGAWVGKVTGEGGRELLGTGRLIGGLALRSENGLEVMNEGVG